MKKPYSRGPRIRINPPMIGLGGLGFVVRWIATVWIAAVLVLIPNQSHAQTSVTDTIQTICPYKAKDLRQVLNYQQFPCSCCTKFCGSASSASSSCDDDRGTCELSYGKCRIRVTKPPASTNNEALSIVLGLLLTILWLITIGLLGKAAFEDERRLITKELLLGRKRLNNEDRSIENWAVGLGCLFFVVSIIPFLLMVKFAKRRARKEIQMKEQQRKRTKTVGTFLGSFESPDNSPRQRSRSRGNIRSVSPSPSPPASPERANRPYSENEIIASVSGVPPNKLPRPENPHRSPVAFAHADIEQMTPHYSLRSTFTLDVRISTDEGEEEFWVPSNDRESPFDISKRVLTRAMRGTYEHLSEIWRAANGRKPDGEADQTNEKQLVPHPGRMVANDEGESSPQRLVRKSESPLKMVQKRQFTPMMSSPSSDDDVERATKRPPIPLRPQQTVPIPPRPQQAVSIPLRPQQTVPIPARPQQAVSIPPRPQQTAPIPLRPQQTVPIPPRPQQAVSIPPRPQQTAPIPPRPQQTVPIPPRPQQAVSIPPRPQQTAPIPPRPQQTVPIPPRPQQAVSIPPRPQQTAPIPPRPEPSSVERSRSTIRIPPPRPAARQVASLVVVPIEDPPVQDFEFL